MHGHKCCAKGRTLEIRQGLIRHCSLSNLWIYALLERTCTPLDIGKHCAAASRSHGALRLTLLRYAVRRLQAAHLAGGGCVLPDSSGQRLDIIQGSHDMLELERHGPQVLVLPAKPHHSPGPCLTQPKMDILHLWQAHAHAAKPGMVKLKRCHHRRLDSLGDSKLASICITAQKARISTEMIPAVRQ